MRFRISSFHQPKTVNAFREGASNRQKRVSPFQPFSEKLKEKKLIFLSVVVFTGAALAINYFTESQIYSDSNLEPIVNLDSLIDKGNESYDRGSMTMPSPITKKFYAFNPPINMGFTIRL